MNAYLAGGGIGAIGILGGAVAALWFRYKYATVLGKLATLKTKHEFELQEHSRTLANAVADAKKYEQALENAEDVAAHYKERLSKVRARELEHATDDDLLRIANDQSGSMRRVLDSEETKEARTSNRREDGNNL